MAFQVKRSRAEVTQEELTAAAARKTSIIVTVIFFFTLALSFVIRRRFWTTRFTRRSRPILWRAKKNGCHFSYITRPRKVFLPHRTTHSLQDLQHTGTAPPETDKQELHVLELVMRWASTHYHCQGLYSHFRSKINDKFRFSRYFSEKSMPLNGYYDNLPHQWTSIPTEYALLKQSLTLPLVISGLRSWPC